jgi:APA family basic amino acid/polyamine antiporter
MAEARPRPVLSLFDAVALTVGVVIGAGIFKTPALVAASAGSGLWVILTWLFGGLISLAGALCYAELVTSYPHTGGEYHFLGRAYGRSTGFLFAWTRLMVMQTGSIALLAFVFGDYMAALVPLGDYGPAWYAAAAVAGFTLLNVTGLQSSCRAQGLLTGITVLGLLVVAVAGFLSAGPVVPQIEPARVSSESLGMAMIFVLLTYGGWNEAAYISAEVRDVRRTLVRALLWSIGLITLVYLLVNLAYLRVLGTAALGSSEVPGADLMHAAFGPLGALLTSALIAVVALTSLNVTIFTGARTSYALARDFRLFRWLDYWHPRTNAPMSALLVQGGIALALVLLGALARQGFQTMVEYISPVFWLFFLLTGLSLFVLRWREPARERPFRVPLYPFTPIIFCVSCAYLLYSSLSYTGAGALAGVLVLLAGLPLLWLARRREARSVAIY